MTNPMAPELTEDNATRYSANPEFCKYAYLSWSPTSYSLSWGEMSFDGPHMVIEDGASFYGCALEEFFTTHKPVLGSENMWYKNAEVLAKQVDIDTDIVTMVDGRVEARSTIPAGEWIIRNPKGEQYCISSENLAKRYIKS